MDAGGLIGFLEKAIYAQRSALRFYLWGTFIVLALALVSAFVGYAFAGSIAFLPESLKWGGPVTGGFIAALSSIPSKEIFSRRDKIAALELLHEQLETLSLGPAANAAELEKLQQRVWQYVEKALGA